MHTNAFSVTIGEALSEPTIGPGMILEKGRTRLYIIGHDKYTQFFEVVQWRRCWGGWKSRYSLCSTGDWWTEADVRKKIAQGFRVVRPAAVDGQPAPVEDPKP